jgi:restriction endonuclease Mrr
MQHSGITDKFRFTFEKTSDEIKKAAVAKIAALAEKNKEREERVAGLRKEYGIDDAALAQILQSARQQEQHARSFTYASGNPGTNSGRMEERTIGAGVVNHLLTENDFIQGDKANIKRLEMIVRNLRPLVRQGHTVDAYALSYDELEFLGF